MSESAILAGFWSKRPEDWPHFGHIGESSICAEGAELTQGHENSIIVLKESKSGANEVFFDPRLSTTMIREEFVKAIYDGKYPACEIRMINGIQLKLSWLES